jgi:hypothetical protein
MKNYLDYEPPNRFRQRRRRWTSNMSGKLCCISALMSIILLLILWTNYYKATHTPLFQEGSEVNLTIISLILGLFLSEGISIVLGIASIILTRKNDLKGQLLYSVGLSLAAGNAFGIYAFGH